jgi:hypothetical protein
MNLFIQNRVISSNFRFWFVRTAVTRVLEYQIITIACVRLPFISLNTVIRTLHLNTNFHVLVTKYSNTRTIFPAITFTIFFRNRTKTLHFCSIIGLKVLHSVYKRSWLIWRPTNMVLNTHLYKKFSYKKKI